MEPGYAQPGDLVSVPGFSGKVWRVVQINMDHEVQCESSRGMRLWVSPCHLDAVAGPFQTMNPDGCR